jgi:pimeloyl-ACP methyl ester carboxylesterase
MRRLLALAFALVPAAVITWVGWRWVTPARKADPELPEGLETEEVWFRSLDGTRLRGLWVPGRKTYPTVVLCHGYYRNLAEPLEVGLALNGAGYNVFLFDFRACGRSGGRFTTVGLKEAWDVEAAVRYVLTRYGRGPVGVLGISMGGAAAITAAASTDEIAAVVADCAYTDLGDIMRLKIPELSPARWTAPLGWLSIAVGEWMAGGRLREVRPVEYVGRLSPRPLLLIYSGRDSYLPPGQPDEMFAAAGEPKGMWVAPGSDHTMARLDHRREYERRVIEFFDRSLRRSRGAGKSEGAAKRRAARPRTRA